jgi:hypothetical protein
MKTAVMISGFPRFTKEFDHLIESFVNYDQLEWFFLFWNSTNNDDRYIPPNWPKNPRDMEKILLSRLPSNSKIAFLKVVDPPKFDLTKQYILTPWSAQKNILTMYYGIFAINQIRKQFGEYDLVVRARGDVGIIEKIDFKMFYEYLKSKPNSVIMPDNHRFGMVGPPVNDIFGIGLPNIMDVYADAFNYIDLYNKEGVPLHGETVLSCHLHRNKISAPVSGFNQIFKTYVDQNGQPDYGQWNSTL